MALLLAVGALSLGAEPVEADDVPYLEWGEMEIGGSDSEVYDLALVLKGPAGYTYPVSNPGFEYKAANGDNWLTLPVSAHYDGSGDTGTFGEYAQHLARDLPDGSYTFRLKLDDNTYAVCDVPLRVSHDARNYKIDSFSHDSATDVYTLYGNFPAGLYDWYTVYRFNEDGTALVMKGDPTPESAGDNAPTREDDCPLPQHWVTTRADAAGGPAINFAGSAPPPAGDAPYLEWGEMRLGGSEVYELALVLKVPAGHAYPSSGHNFEYRAVDGGDWLTLSLPAHYDGPDDAAFGEHAHHLARDLPDGSYFFRLPLGDGSHAACDVPLRVRHDARNYTIESFSYDSVTKTYTLRGDFPAGAYGWYIVHMLGADGTELVVGGDPTPGYDDDNANAPTRGDGCPLPHHWVTTRADADGGPAISFAGSAPPPETGVPRLEWGEMAIGGVGGPDAIRDLALVLKGTDQYPENRRFEYSAVGSDIWQELQLSVKWEYGHGMSDFANWDDNNAAFGKYAQHLARDLPDGSYLFRLKLGDGSYAACDVPLRVRHDARNYTIDSFLYNPVTDVYTLYGDFPAGLYDWYTVYRLDADGKDLVMKGDPTPSGFEFRGEGAPTREDDCPLPQHWVTTRADAAGGPAINFAGSAPPPAGDAPYLEWGELIFESSGASDLALILRNYDGNGSVTGPLASFSYKSAAVGNWQPLASGSVYLQSEEQNGVRIYGEPAKILVNDRGPLPDGSYFFKLDLGNGSFAESTVPLTVRHSERAFTVTGGSYDTNTKSYTLQGFFPAGMYRLMFTDGTLTTGQSGRASVDANTLTITVNNWNWGTGEYEQLYQSAMPAVEHWTTTRADAGGPAISFVGSAPPPEAAKSSDATLSVLEIDGVTLSPAFDANTASYTANVPYGISSVTTTARANHANASVGGAGERSLAVGANTISILVTAEDGVTVKTYTITVTRAAYSGGGGRYTPPEKQVTVPAASGDVAVTYTPNGETAKLDLPAAKVAEIIAQAEGEFAKINLSEASGITEAQLPATAIAEIAKSDKGLNISLPAGELTLSPEATTALADAANGKAITVKVETLVPSEALNARQQAKVGDRPVYDISIGDGSRYISDFGGGLVTITLPYTLKAGEKASGIKVYYLDSDGNVQEVSTMYDIRTKSVIFTTDHLSRYYIGYEEWINIYPDVPADEWYCEYVEYVSKNGIMNGTDLGFEPQTALTRAMLITILYKYVKPEAGVYAGAFADVPAGEWYSDPIAWAAKEGLVAGDGENFHPDRAITREEMMQILFNFAKWQGKGPAGNWAIRLDYPDVNEVSDWANEAVMWVTMKGIVTGTPINDVNHIDPKGGATRAQAAAVLTKYIETTR
jgi:hypothetical protein